jgi:hypothetical protein
MGVQDWWKGEKINTQNFEVAPLSHTSSLPRTKINRCPTSKQPNQILRQLSLFLIWCCSYALLQHSQKEENHHLPIKSFRIFVWGLQTLEHMKSCNKKGQTSCSLEWSSDMCVYIRWVVKGKIKYDTHLKWHILLLPKLDYKTNTTKKPNQILEQLGLLMSWYFCYALSLSKSKVA